MALHRKSLEIPALGISQNVGAFRFSSSTSFSSVSSSTSGGIAAIVSLIFEPSSVPLRLRHLQMLFDSLQPVTLRNMRWHRIEKLQVTKYRMHKNIFL